MNRHIRYGVCNSRVVKIIGEGNRILQKYQIIDENGRLRFIDMRDVIHVYDTREEANRALSTVLNPLAQEQNMGLLRDMWAFFTGASSVQHPVVVPEPVSAPVVQVDEPEDDPIIPLIPPVPPAPAAPAAASVEVETEIDEETLEEMTENTFRRYRSQKDNRMMIIADGDVNPLYDIINGLSRTEEGLMSSTVTSFADYETKQGRGGDLIRERQGRNWGYTEEFFARAVEVHQMKQLAKWNPDADTRKAYRGFSWTEVAV